MNSLIQRLLGFVKSHPYRSFFITVTTVVVVSLVLRLLFPAAPTPRPTPTIRSPQFDAVQSSNPISQVVVTTERLPTQTEAKIYAISNYVPSNQLLANIAAILKLDPALYSKYAFVSRDNTENIILNELFKIVSYDNSSNQPEADIVDLSQAIRAANSFLAKLKLSTDSFTLDEGATRYYDSSTEPSEVSASQATNVTLHYRRDQDDLPIALSTSPGNQIVIKVSSKGVFKALIPALFFTQTERGTEKLITTNEAVAQVITGNYYILGQINNPITFESITSPITRFDVTDVKIEYRLDDKQQLLLPYYRLGGAASFENGVSNIPVTLITPAFLTTP